MLESRCIPLLTSLISQIKNPLRVKVQSSSSMAFKSLPSTLDDCPEMDGSQLLNRSASLIKLRQTMTMRVPMITPRQETNRCATNMLGSGVPEMAMV